MIVLCQQHKAMLSSRCIQLDQILYQASSPLIPSSNSDLFSSARCSGHTLETFLHGMKLLLYDFIRCCNIFIMKKKHFHVDSSAALNGVRRALTVDRFTPAIFCYQVLLTKLTFNFKSIQVNLTNFKVLTIFLPNSLISDADLNCLHANKVC
jgi:hypothetical protein